MTITIYDNGEVFTPDKLLGFVGETAHRTVTFVYSNVTGADGYKLRLLYKDGLIYEIPIDQLTKTVTLDGSVLREAGRIQAQWIAYAMDELNEEYELVAKSQMFELIIGKSIGDDVSEIPTYEAIVAAAVQLVEDGMTREEVITAIQQIIETGEVQDLDSGFVTTLKEQNNGIGFKVWLGTTAEYDALVNAELVEANTLYIRTDDTSAADVRAALEDSGWKTLTISGTGFTAGSPVPKYRKIGNRVIVKGQIAVDMDNVSDVTTVFATLPSGYRPATALYRLIPGEGDRQARLYVSSSGGVNINYFKTYAGDPVTGSHWVQLDCEFLTD